MLYTSAESWRGSGVSFLNIAAGLQQRGHEVRLITTHPDVTARFRERGHDVSECSIRGTGLPAALAVKAAAKGSQVIMTDRPRDLRVAVMARVLGGPRIIHRYNLSRRDAPRDVVTRFGYLGSVRVTVFLTKDAAQRVVTQAPFVGRMPVTVIPEGVDSAVFRRDDEAATRFRASFGLGDDPFVLAVGALSPEKRYDVIVEAIASLGERAPRLVIAGAGELQSTIEHQAAERGVRLTIVPRLPRNDLVGAYSAAGCLAHACEVETFGLAVAEAMACECGVVVPDGGALPGIVGDSGEAGVIVPARDAAMLGRAVHRMLVMRDRTRAIGRAARERIASHYSLGAMQSAYGELVEAVGND